MRAPRLASVAVLAIAAVACSRLGPGVSGLVDTVPPGGEHVRLVYLGTDTQYKVALGDGAEVTVRVQNAHEAAISFRPGDAATLRFDAGAAKLLVD